MSQEVKVTSLPKCDTCGDTALYDAKTVMGPWANLCDMCFNTYTTGQLGLGLGQRLMVA